MLDYWHHALSWASNVDFWGFLKLAFVAYASYVLCANVVVNYNKLPCVGVSNWPFSYALATVRSVYDFRYQIAEAYDKYLTRGLACRIPDFVFGPLVLLPTTKLKYIMSQPTEVVDPHEALHDAVQMKNLLWYARSPFEKPLHALTPKKWVGMRYESSKEAMVHDVDRGITNNWGTDTENWKEVNIYKTALSTTIQAIWSAFVGEPYCRDPTLWLHGQRTADYLFPIARLVACFPPSMRPLAAWVLGWPVRYSYNQLAARLIPIIKIRKEEQEQAERDGKLESERQLSNDIISWFVYEERQNNTFGENTGHRICSLVIGLNLVSIQTTSILASNTMRCLSRSPRSQEIVEKLRTEIQEVLAEEGNQWTKNSLAKMTGLGSCIREALRLHPILFAFPMRAVMQDLLIDEEKDIWLKRGTRIAFPVRLIHTDERFYPNPFDFDAFRFAQPHNSKLENPEANPNATLLSVTNTFLGWGAGKNACPGRFLASDMLKLMLARVLMNYDLKAAGEHDADFARTEHTNTISVGSFLLPDTTSTAFVKRRAFAGV